MKFKKRPGARAIENDKQAQAVGEFLSAKFPDGKIEPQELVDISRNKNTPTHNLFEWNNGRAADLYRLDQARHIIRAIVIVTDDNKEVQQYHRVFIESEDRHAYTELDQCLKAPALWNQVLNQALKEAQAWAERYKSYKELKPIHKAILAVTKEQTHAKPNKRTRGNRKESNTSATRA